MISNNRSLKNIYDKIYVGESGGGIVKVHMRMDMIVMKTELDYTIFPNNMPDLTKDSLFLSDLFTSATNQAIQKIYDDVNQMNKKYMSNLLGEVKSERQ